MICSNCGADNPGGTKFCGNCGGLLNNTVITATDNTNENNGTIPRTEYVPTNTNLRQTFDSMWVIGAVISLIALVCSYKMIAAVLATVSLLLLIIAGIGLLKIAKLKGIFVLCVAGIVLFFSLISIIISGKNDKAGDVKQDTTSIIEAGVTNELS